MDDGGGIIIWVIIFAVAILQGIGQKRKGAGKTGQAGPGSARSQQAPRGEVGQGTLPPPAPSGPSSPRPLEADERPTSEGLIPTDVWEEILGLARGKPPPSKLEPSPESEASEAVTVELREERPAPAARPFPVSHGANAVLHPSKPADARSRLAFPPTRRPEPGSEESQGQPQELTAGLFGGGSQEELRKAIVLKEVLGPPISLRED